MVPPPRPPASLHTAAGTLSPIARMKFASVAFLAAAMGSAQAWWDVGHQAVGAGAYQLMKNEKSKENLDHILSYLDTLYNDEFGEWPYGNFSVDQTQRPQQKSNLLAYAAVWPDTIKGFYNVKVFDNWHYINKKYDPLELDKDNTGCNTNTQTNIVTIMEQLVKQVPDMYSGRSTAHWYQHFALGYIAHQIGDIHQPYHAMGRCIMWEGKLDQDLGGNRWTVIMPSGQVTNAHAMWDSVAMLWGNAKQEEIEKDDPTYEKFAADLIARISVDDLKAAGYDVDFAADGDYKGFKDRLQIWLTESNKIAQESYDRTPFNETVTQETIDWVLQTSELRTVVAMHRFAALLDGMLADIDTPKFAVSTSARAPADVVIVVEEASGTPVWVPIVAAAAGLALGGAVAFFAGRARGKRQFYESSTSF